MNWRIYYGDGSTFDDEQGPWSEAPARDVQGLVVADDVVGRTVESNDFYVWWPDVEIPWGVDWAGLLDYLISTGHRSDRSLSTYSLDELADAGVKIGRSLSNEDWRPLHARMTNDPDFPRKSARYPRERTA